MTMITSSNHQVTFRNLVSFISRLLTVLLLTLYQITIFGYSWALLVHIGRWPWSANANQTEKILPLQGHSSQLSNEIVYRVVWLNLLAFFALFSSLLESFVFFYLEEENVGGQSCYQTTPYFVILSMLFALFFLVPPTENSPEKISLSKDEHAQDNVSQAVLLPLFLVACYLVSQFYKKNPILEVVKVYDEDESNFEVVLQPSDPTFCPLYRPLLVALINGAILFKNIYLYACYRQQGVVTFELENTSARKFLIWEVLLSGTGLLAGFFFSSYSLLTQLYAVLVLIDVLQIFKMKILVMDFLESTKLSKVYVFPALALLFTFLLVLYDSKTIGFRKVKKPKVLKTKVSWEDQEEVVFNRVLGFTNHQTKNTADHQGQFNQKRAEILIPTETALANEFFLKTLTALAMIVAILNQYYYGRLNVAYLRLVDQVDVDGHFGFDFDEENNIFTGSLRLAFKGWLYFASCVLLALSATSELLRRTQPTNKPIRTVLFFLLNALLHLLQVDPSSPSWNPIDPMVLAVFSVHRCSLSWTLLFAQLTSLTGEYLFENFPRLNVYLAKSLAGRLFPFFTSRGFDLVFFRLGSIALFGILANQVNINLIYHVQEVTDQRKILFKRSDLLNFLTAQAFSMYLSIVTLFVGVYTEVIIASKKDETLFGSKETARYLYHLLSLTYLFWVPFSAHLQSTTSNSSTLDFSIFGTWHSLFAYVCYLGAIQLYLVYLWVTTFQHSFTDRNIGKRRAELVSKLKTIRSSKRNR